ncbi:MAG: hypothetical protein IPP03_22910 [Dechloromonas sp.]|nr:hypothetical protein [Candidatus Dechloromonas phosphoritropha]
MPDMPVEGCNVDRPGIVQQLAHQNQPGVIIADGGRAISPGVGIGKLFDDVGFLFQFNKGKLTLVR